AAGDIVGNERIAVPVPADPGTELEEGRHLEGLAWKEHLKRAVELLVHLTGGFEQRFVEEVESPVDLLRNGRLLQPEFSRHPEQLDVVAKLVDQRGAFPRGPAGRLEIHQPAI